MLLDILVPKTGTTAPRDIAARSAIVSSRDLGIPGIRVVYFEGNLFGASNLVEYHQRLVSAAGRLEKRYPTTAVMAVDPDEYEVVAVFDTNIAAVISVSNEDALTEWAAESMEAICGVMLDEGDVDYDGAMRVVANGRQLGGPSGTRISYHSRAGQLVELDFAIKRATVKNRDGLADVATSMPSL